MSEAPIRATLKAGAGYDAPWLSVDGSTPDELQVRLEAVSNGGVIQALIVAANALQAANNAAPLLPQSEQAPPQQAQPNGWGQAQPAQQPQQQSAPPQQNQQQPSQGGWQAPATTHPEGLACHCGQPLQFGKTRTNRGQWKCPDYRWNNGSPNDHRLEWAN